MEVEQRPEVFSFSGADSTAAFSAAEVASAATAAVLRAQGASSDAVAAKLCGAQAAPAVCDRLAAVHRLNEHFAACGSFEDAEALARALATGRPSLGAALVALMVDGDALVELVVQLMHSLSLHADGAAMLLRAGALPVLAATLRADEPLLRAQGLSLLISMSERPEMALPLAKAGALKLVTFLARTSLPTTSAASASSAATWPVLLEIADAMLATPAAVPAVQRQQLRDVLAKAAVAHKAGTLPLGLHDGARLAKLMLTLRALALTDPPPGQRARPK